MTRRPRGRCSTSPHARRTTGPTASGSCPPAHKGINDFPVAEVDRLVADDLIVLVALAGDQDRIPRPGESECSHDRLLPVRLPVDYRTRLDSGHDFVDDPLGVFVTGIVGGDHRNV